VSTYSPLDLAATTVDAAPATVDLGREAGRNVGSLFVTTPSTATTRIATTLRGVLTLEHHRYELQIRHQPTLHPDDVRVRITVPAGWELDQARNVRVVGPREAIAHLRLTRTTSIRVRIAPARSQLDLWQQLRAGRT
jgi:hypothetical protein